MRFRFFFLWVVLVGAPSGVFAQSNAYYFDVGVDTEHLEGIEVLFRSNQVRHVSGPEINPRSSAHYSVRASFDSRDEAELVRANLSFLIELGVFEGQMSAVGESPPAECLTITRLAPARVTALMSELEDFATDLDYRMVMNVDFDSDPGETELSEEVWFDVVLRARNGAQRGLLSLVLKGLLEVIDVSETETEIADEPSCDRFNSVLRSRVDLRQPVFLTDEPVPIQSPNQSDD